jgi:hypothetical protein
MSFVSFRRGLLAAASALLLAALSGCTTMPVTSMVKLARTDFTTVDPAALRIAVKLPMGLRPRREGVRLRVAATVADLKQEQSFVLADLDDAGELLSLAGEVTADVSIYAFRLDPADVPRLVAMRQEMLARKASGAKGSLTLSVAADACRTGPLPATTLLTTYLRTEAAGDFFPLARDVDLRKIVPKDAGKELIPPCK